MSHHGILLYASFARQVFNVFLATTLSGSVLDSLNELISEPTSVVSLLAESLPGVAGFFINYVLLQGLAGIPSDLLRLVPLIITQVKLKLLGKTARDRAQIINDGNGRLGGGYFAFLKC